MLVQDILILFFSIVIGVSFGAYLWLLLRVRDKLLNRKDNQAANDG